MSLTKEQEAALRKAVAEGKTLGEIQGMLAQVGAAMTYMELRLLVDDLGLAVQEKAHQKTIPPMGREENREAKNENGGANEGRDAEMPSEKETAEGGLGGVSVEVDKVVRPGALLSGTVDFSDGTKVAWALDEMGRLGLMGAPKGYKPTPEDVAEFQAKLRAAIEARGGM